MSECAVKAFRRTDFLCLPRTKNNYYRHALRQVNRNVPLLIERLIYDDYRYLDQQNLIPNPDVQHRLHWALDRVSLSIDAAEDSGASMIERCGTAAV